MIDTVFLERTLQYVEKARVSSQVSITHLAKAKKKDDIREAILKKLQDLEDYIVKQISSFVESHPAYPWFSRIKGIGRENIAKVVYMIDIKKAPTISSLWKFAGLYPGAKQKTGETSPYNSRLRSMCFRLATSLMRAKGKYYDYYLKRKKELQDRFISEGKEIKAWEKMKKKEKEAYNEANKLGYEAINKLKVIPEGLVHGRARRKMIKLFLAHLWLVWREAEGLPITKPYAIDILNHTKYIDPYEMCDK